MRINIRRRLILMSKAVLPPLALLAGALCAAPGPGAAEFLPQGTVPAHSVPGGITFQGRLQQNGVPVTSEVAWGFVFRVWDAALGGSQIGPTMVTSAQVDSGLFNVSIPVTTNTLVGGPGRWIDVEVNQPGQVPGSVAPLTPRARLFSVPYAQVAKAIEGTIDVSTAGIFFTTSPYTTSAAFCVSTGAFVGVGTAHPYSLLTVSSGVVTIDGTGARLRLSSGPMIVDGAGAKLDVRGPAVFGNGATRASFDAAGTLHLIGPLPTASGGTGQDLSAAPANSLPYFSGVGTLSTLAIGAANKTLRSNGAVPGWSVINYPGSVVSGGLLYGSAPDTVAQLPAGTANRILRTDGTNPGWGAVDYPGSAAQGVLLYGSGVNTVAGIPVGTAGKLLQSNGTVPGWTTATYPGTAAQGDVLYGSAADTVSRLAKSAAATRYLSNTGASNSPAWDQVDLSNGVTASILPTANGGTGNNLAGSSAWGSLPYYSNAGVWETLAPAVSGRILTTSGAGFDPVWTDLATSGLAGEAKNLSGGLQGSIPYQSGLSLTSMLAAGTAGQLLRTAGAGADPTWTTAIYPNTTTAGEILYSDVNDNVTGLATAVNSVLMTNGVGSGVPFFGTDLPTGVTMGGGYIYRDGGLVVGVSAGGTGTDLSGAAIGGLIHRGATTLAGSAALTGVIRGDAASSGEPRALNGTAGYNAYWVTASTIGAEQYVASTRGGTGTDLSAVATNELIYMNAGVLAGTGIMPAGVLKGNGAAVPTAMNGTASYNAYWSDANTLAAEQYTAITRGGTGADLSGVATNSLIYKTAGALGGTGVMPTGVLKGNGAAVPTAMTGTANYNTYWSDANTLGSEQYISLSRGGLGSDLSGLSTNELIYKTAGGLGGTGILSAGVLKGNGAAVPTAMNGTANYNAYWSDANTLAAEQYTPMSRGGTEADLTAAATGGLIYKGAANLTGSAALTGVLKGNGAAVPTAMTGTANYNAYWSDANTLAAEQYTPMTRGGTETNLSAVATGGLIYKAAGNLTGSVALTGVLKGNASAAPTAMTGTGAGYNTYWSDANTIAGEQYVSMARGGASASLSGVATGGLIYKAAGNLTGSAALTGVLKGNDTAAPTAMTGTANYNAYWSDANTLAAEQYTALTRGGAGASLSGVATGGLIYKAAGNLTGSGALTGVLKGNGGAAPTAMTGTANYNAYWSDANTLAAEQYTATTRGGTGADLSGEATGGLIYKTATGLDGSLALTGVLKGNGAAAPSVANPGDFAETTYKWFNPTSVAITGTRIGTATGLTLISRSVLQLRTLDPDGSGKLYYCNNCSPPKIVVSTGTAAGEFASIDGSLFQ